MHWPESSPLIASEVNSILEVAIDTSIHIYLGTGCDVAMKNHTHTKQYVLEYGSLYSE